ncbi:MAG: YdcF family protein [Leptospiraceae bacterium]|nr:YdcF family protein [Leptospiraceae bacterium]
MFFFFSKILTIFIFPLPFCILLGVILSLTIKGKRKIVYLTPFMLLWLASSFPVSQFLARSLESEFPPIEIETLDSADVIVVLGGMINPMSYHETRVELLSSAERLTDTIRIYNLKKSNKILFTGGSGILFHDEVNEADYAKKFLIQMGVREEDIILEKQSRNTKENASLSKPILEKIGAKKIILITSAFHMKRSKEIFDKLGLEVKFFPTDYRALKTHLNWDTAIPSVGSLETTTICLKEWIGIIAYRVFN